MARVFEYWRNIDQAIGDRIETATIDKRATGKSDKGVRRFD